MLSVLSRRAIFTAARTHVLRPCFNVVRKNPVGLNHAFSTSPRVSTTVAKPTTKNKDAKPAATKKAAAKAKPKAKKAAPKKAKATMTKKKPVVKKVAPTLKSSSVLKPPPRSFSGYALFVRDHMKGTTGAVVKDAMVNLAPRWRGLSETEKDGYKERASAERVKMAENFKNYIDAVDPLTLARYNRLRRKEGKPVLRNPNATAKHPTPPFFQFLSVLRVKPEFKDWSVQDLAREGGKQWRAFSPTEKAHYTKPKSI